MVLVLTFGVVLFVTVALSVAMDVTWTAEFAESGWIRPFPEDVARRVESGTLRAAYDTRHLPGPAVAAPLNTNTQLLWYRKDLVPNPPQTWDQMIDIAVALAERDLPHYVEVQGAVRGHHGLVQHTPASAGGRSFQRTGRCSSAMETLPGVPRPS